jgi:diguanylate cyclase (GGDEF)-like protein/PAS domain S-box-containing protein
MNCIQKKGADSGMRKGILLPVSFLCSVIAALAVILWVAVTYRQNGLLFGGTPSDFNTGWTFSDGDPASLPGPLEMTAENNAVLIGTLPPTLESGIVLSLNTSYASLSVTVGDKQVYSWDIQGKALFIRPFGLSEYVITLPESSAGQQIMLTFTPNQSGADVTVYSVSLGSGFSAASALIRENLGTVILFFILAVVFCFSCLTLVIFRRRFTKQITAESLNLAAFIALAAAWMFTDSSLPLLLSGNIAVTLYISLFSQMLLPAPLLMFMRGFTPHGKRVLSGLAALTLLNFTICLILLLLGCADLIQTLFTTHILELLTCAAVPAYCGVEFFRYKRRDMLEVFVGIGALCVFGLLSVILFALGGNPGSGVFTRVGLTVFVLALGIGLYRRGILELARSKSYANLTLSIPSGICRIESFQTGRILFANSFYYRMLGYTEAEAQKAGFAAAFDRVLPEDLASMKDKIDAFISDGQHSFETETRYFQKNGEIIWVLARYKMERSGSGPITLVMIDITDRKRMEEQLRISEEEYRIATLHSNKHIVRLDIRSRIVHRPPGLNSVLSAVPELDNMPHSLISSGLLAQDSVDAFKGLFEAIYRGDSEGSAVVSILNSTAGEFRWYHFDFTSIFSDGGEPVQAVISFYDVTLQRQKELAFQRWQQSYNAIPKNASNFFEYNLTSDLFEHEEGGMFPPIPEDLPKTLQEVSAYFTMHHIAREDRSIWASFMSRERLLEAYASGLHADKMEFRRLSGGLPKWTSLSVQLIPDPYSPDVKSYFLLKDIDEQKKAEISLRERSTLDALTGLLNRATFIEKFNEILMKSSLETQHALIMLDIDNFKMINDSLGHTAGDALLTSIAGKLKYALRSDDLCGRLGGDEFVICLKSMHLGKPLATRVNDLCNMLSDEHSWGVTVSASFGIAGFPYDGTTFDELYQKADIALYKAKARGRGCYAVYDPQLSFDDMAIPTK